jgi:hypothetical protein
MHLIQILLPLATSGGKPRFEAVLEKLTTKFGGATAFINSPARGLWEDHGEREQDRIVTVEVMVEDFEADWWADYRKGLEKALKQKEIVIRAIEMVKV